MKKAKLAVFFVPSIVFYLETEIKDLQKALALSPVPYLFARGKLWYDFLSRQFIMTTPALVIGWLMFLPFHTSLKNVIPIDPTRIALMATSLFLPMTIILTVLHTYAARNNDRAKDARVEIERAHLGIFPKINDIANSTVRNSCLLAYIIFLRSVYCTAERLEFVVKLADEEFHTVGALAQWVQCKFREAEIDSTLIGSNGPFHALYTGRARVNVVVSYLIPLSMYITSVVMFLIAYSALALFVARLGIESIWFGGSFSGIFTYAIALVVVIAINRALPFGRRLNEINLHRFFREMEEWIMEGLKVAEINRQLAIQH